MSFPTLFYVTLYCLFDQFSLLQNYRIVFLTEDKYPEPGACSQPNISLTNLIMYVFTNACKAKQQI